MFSRIIDSVKDTLIKESEAIEEINANLDEEQINKIVELVMDCKGKIITTGCGTSAAAAKKIAHTLSCIECPALFLSPSDAVHGGLGVVRNQDIVIVFSKGGETQEINNIIPSCKVKGATIIAITESEGSYIAREADALLKIKVSKEPDDFNMLATSSILATIAVFDAICIAITRFRGFTKEQFAVIHPGGKVGNTLKRKNKELEDVQDM
ncbi:KpsF/GutQ family protein [Neobacillus niacini]|uniref:KpsF/GutQ family sugar-phosphate isomerase n=1 Tax=Neobacillus niacini TaxID=86668 RepID=UPI0027864351|nr:SIS domain-containing protein [Neobacillus niacini]MDQ1004891.1 KpsF/GutQ family protein [Neobacillus niacini]